MKSRRALVLREKGLAHRTGKGRKKDALIGMKQAHGRIDSSEIVLIFIIFLLFGRAFSLVTTIFATAFANAS
jgi:hypothetical protein